MRNPFPAFQWYPRDWLASDARALMTLEQRGAYLDLLSRAWLDDPPCSLPDDDAELAMLSGLGEKWAEAGALIRKSFVAKDGRLWNTKQLEVFRRARALSRTRAEIGKRGGEQRARNKAETDQAIANQLLSKRPSKSKLSGAVAVASSVSEESPTNVYPPGAEKRQGPDIPEELLTCLSTTRFMRALGEPSNGDFWDAQKRAFAAYPWLSLTQELLNADAWIAANATKRPTTRGLGRFFHAWLNRSVEIKRRQQPSAPSNAHRSGNGNGNGSHTRGAARGQRATPGAPGGGEIDWSAERDDSREPGGRVA